MRFKEALNYYNLIIELAMEADISLNSSRRLGDFPRGKSHMETEAKTTIGVYLPKTLVEKAEENS